MSSGGFMSAIGGGAALLGGRSEKKAAGKARKAAQLGEARAYKALAPYRKLGREGVAGVQELMTDPSSFQGSPGYMFRMEQGQQAMERSAAARGKMFSGSLLKELVGYGQGLASQEYGAEFQRRMGMAGMGQAAATGQAQASMTGAGMQAQAAQQAGQAQVGMFQGVGSALGGGLGFYKGYGG